MIEYLPFVLNSH